MQNQPYIILLSISSLFSAFVIGILLRRRRSPGANQLLVFLAGTLIWSLTYALHWHSNTPEMKQLWLDATYIGVVITPPSMVGFILQLTGYYIRWISSRMYVLYIIPIVTLVLIATDPLHGLFYGGKRIPGQSRIFDGGSWFWVNVVYLYLLILIGIGIMLIASRRPGKLQRTQNQLILAGTMFPVISNVLGFLGVGGGQTTGIDLTPLAFSLTGLFLTIALVYKQLLDLIPISRDMWVERMSEGMILLDRMGRIVDLNPSARRLIDLPADVEGELAVNALEPYPELMRWVQNTLAHRFDPSTRGDASKSVQADPCVGEVQLDRPEARYLQVQAVPISNRTGDLRGTLIILSDISERKAAEQDLELRLGQIEVLQASLREQAIRDPLTGLFNRRYLDETLPRELARAERDDRPISVIMLDIDHFKALNDVYGHTAGDLVLVRLAQILVANIRPADFVTRYGGEEFLITLIDASVDAAALRAESWLKAVQNDPVIYAGQPLEITVSAGVAGYPDDGREVKSLIEKADAALYAAKAAGRNRVMTSSSEFTGEERSIKPQ